LVDQWLYNKYAFFNMAHHSEIIAIIAEFSEDIKINDVSKMPYLINQGKVEAEKHIDDLNKMLGSKKMMNGKE